MHQDYVRAEAAPNTEAEALLEYWIHLTHKHGAFRLLYIDDLSAFKRMMLKYY